MANKSKRPASYDLKAADRKRDWVVKGGLTALVIVFAVVLVAYIVMNGKPKADADKVQAARDALALIPDVASCKIGLEQGITAADYPLIRLVPSRITPGRPYNNRTAETLVYFGMDVTGADAGGLEAVYLALRSVASAGDTIVLESPTYFHLLQMIESLGMRALEIPTHPRTGICLDALEQALAQWPIRACVVMPRYKMTRKREATPLAGALGIPFGPMTAWAGVSQHGFSASMCSGAM